MLNSVYILVLVFSIKTFVSIHDFGMNRLLCMKEYRYKGKKG